MGNILNLVYDNWEIGTEQPKPNGKKIFHNNREFEYLRENNFEYELFRFSDIHKFPEKMFFYFITPGSIDINKPLPLSDDIINYSHTFTNLNIVFLNPTEYETMQALIKIDSDINKLGIEPNKIWVINNNSNLNKYKTEFNLKINVYKNNYLNIELLNQVKQKKIIKFKPNKNGSFFICLNCREKIHRHAILSYLMKNNMLSDTNWSYKNTKSEYLGTVVQTEDIESFFSSLLYNEDLNNLLPELITINEIKYKASKYEKYAHDNLSGINYMAYSTKGYEESYVNIVTETLLFENEIHISEKSFKPFYYYQFPLIIASKGHLKALKEEYDFDLFEDVINIDYDTEIDDKKRFKIFTNEISRIYKNKEFFIEFYKNNKDRFITNHNKFINIKKDFDFLKKLSELNE